MVNTWDMSAQSYTLSTAAKSVISLSLQDKKFGGLWCTMVSATLCLLIEALRGTKVQHCEIPHIARSGIDCVRG